MRNNITALKHPTIVRKIRRAIWLAKLEAHAKVRDCRKAQKGIAQYRGTQYVENRKGHNIMRVDWYYGSGVVVYGDQSRNITNMVEAVLYSEARVI